MPYEAAVKVALHVKKELVDGDLLDVSQAQLEATIFRVLRKRAFGDDFISRYRMLSSFHLKRAPLVLLVVGGVCTGKTTLATKLSQVCFRNEPAAQMVNRVARLTAERAVAALEFAKRVADGYGIRGRALGRSAKKTNQRRTVERRVMCRC